MYVIVHFCCVHRKRYIPLDIPKLKYYFVSRSFKTVLRQSSKPLLKQQSTDLHELSAQDSLEVEQQLAKGEDDQFLVDADYSQFREELLDTTEY